MQGLNEQLRSATEGLTWAVPELILSAALLLVIVAGLFFRGNGNARFNILTMVSAAASLIVVVSRKADVYLFNHLMHRDGLADFLMVLVDVSVILTCLMTLRRAARRNASEYYALVIAIALGSHLLLMSASFVVTFLSLELISISSYVLAGYSFNRAGSEGSLKYFLFGSVASAIMLYGFSLLYGFTGTLDFTSQPFFERLVDENSPLLLIGALMALSGFLFKMAAAPMQTWAPDIYEAAPMPVIAFLSVAPKLAALGALAKFLLAMHLFGQGYFDWQPIVSVIAILSIGIGNFSALWQKHPKRMMAYSSIAHSGFLLVGIAAFLPQGIGFMLFYAAVYLLMNYAVFALLEYFEKQGVGNMASFAGLGKSHVVAMVCLTLALVALTGLPPTAGFTAKLLIFSGLWDAYVETDKSLLLWLLIFGLLNTVVSLFYYMRIPYYAYIKTGGGSTDEKTGASENLLGLILVVLIVGIFFLPGLLMGLINRINFVF